jgi:hypothetical protein
VPLAERGPYLDLDAATRVPTPATAPPGLEESERRVELRIRRFRCRPRQGLAKCHPRGPALRYPPVRPEDYGPLLLPIEALRHRGDGLPRCRLVRPPFEYASAGDERLLLHFGAVDYRATVWVNGTHVASHEGGHTPFSADVTHALADEARDNVVVIRAEDPSRDVTIPRGKQYWDAARGALHTIGRPRGSHLSQHLRPPL